MKWEWPRVSLGPGFLKIAIQAMRNLALKLQDHDGITDIVENKITLAIFKRPGKQK